MSTLLVVLLIGATVRMTRLLTADTILERPRAWLERHLPESISYLFRCDWCMSVWVGFAVFTFGWFAPPAWSTIISGALTASLLTGWSALTQTAIEVTVWGEDDDVR